MTRSTPSNTDPRVKVFTAGSRRITRLDAEVLHRLNNIADKNLPVVVGDAHGADKAIQQHLHDRGYRAVEVFCSGHHCRHNIGDWPVRPVASDSPDHDARFYTAKDLIMANEATIGLMIWDGDSIGTLANVLRLLAQGKKAVIYTVPEKTTSNLKTMIDWDRFMAHHGTQLRYKGEQRVRLLETARPVAAAENPTVRAMSFLL
jgi:hypothetical protein